MRVRILSIRGTLMPAIEALPETFNGWTIAGGTPVTYVGDEGIFSVQQIARPMYSIRYHDYQVKEKTGIKIQRNDEGLVTIAVLGKPFRHTIGGVGRFRMNRGFFASLFSGQWESLLHFEYTAPLVMLETQWTTDFLEQYLPAESAWLKHLSRPLPPVPKMIGYPYRRLTAVMSELISHVMYSPYEAALRGKALDDLMKEYLSAVLQEAGNAQWLSGIISTADLEKIARAQSLIAENLDAHHFTVDIAAAVGMNECKLKALFRQVTGMGTFDYLMYLRCSAVRDEILSTDLPLKAFVKKAGYRDLANFITGFRRHMGISPAALRRK